MRRTVVAFAFGLLASAAIAQENFPGTNLPITMKPSDLTAEYWPVKLKEQSSGIFGDYYTSSYFQFSSLGIRGNDERMLQLFEILPVSWTRNEMAEVYGQKFIVTYILEPSQESLRAFAEGKPLPEPMLKLKLMKADQIGSIEPFPELNREKYLTILAEFAGVAKPAPTPANRTLALSNAKQVALGIMMYLADYDDLMPYVQSTPSLQKLIAPYTRNSEIWKTLNPVGAGLLRLNMSISGVKVTDIEDPANTPLVYDPNAFPDGTHLVAFADGHAKYISAEEWAGLQKNLRLKLKRHGKPIK